MPVFVSMIILSYFCGSVPVGKLIAHGYGVDIQKRGSGNIGFANVLRVLGWRAALPVLLLDTLKGMLPTLLASYYLGVPAGFIVGVCAIIGHVFPLWLRFKGGKGIATGLGVLLGTTPVVGTIGLGVYIVASLLLRNSSYASMMAGLAVAASGVGLFPQYAWAYGMLIGIAAWTLRKNILGTVPNYDV